jgi:class 3 adenylate cyclase
MSEWEKELGEMLTKYSEDEFNYIDTKDITRAEDIDYGCSGVYMEGTVIYFEMKNLQYILKELGRRKAAQAYTMLHAVISSLAQRHGAFVNCYAPNAFLIVTPGKEDSNKTAVKTALKLAYALSESFKHQFSEITGLGFSMGLDHGHIMGTKNLSDNGYNHMAWFGSCIYKAMRISKECDRPFYVGISGSIYHNLDEDLRIAERRILGIKKKVEIWTKVTYQYENVKKHLYQTNHKISLDEE